MQLLHIKRGGDAAESSCFKDGGIGLVKVFTGFSGIGARCFILFFAGESENLFLFGSEIHAMNRYLSCGRSIAENQQELFALIVYGNNVYLLCMLHCFQR